ncbi:hypothetical protein [Algicola sagamiensis]|uniref:hypothetical protein n=1 Tax=Algicola sagamiensis TaxID=163869 RepID=UPI00036AD35E|nr:hypothetical protein [Algicola sagamiensis]
MTQPFSVTNKPDSIHIPSETPTPDTQDSTIKHAKPLANQGQFTASAKETVSEMTKPSSQQQHFSQVEEQQHGDKKTKKKGGVRFATEATTESPDSPRTKLVKTKSRKSIRSINRQQSHVERLTRTKSKRNLDVVETLKSKDVEQMEKVKRTRKKGSKGMYRSKELASFIAKQKSIASYQKVQRNGPPTYGMTSNPNMTRVFQSARSSAAASLRDQQLQQITQKDFLNYQGAKPVSTADRFSLVAGRFIGNIVNSMSVKENTFLASSQTDNRNHVIFKRSYAVGEQMQSILFQLDQNLHDLGIKKKPEMTKSAIADDSEAKKSKNESHSMTAKDERALKLQVAAFMNGEGYGTCGPTSKTTAALYKSYMNHAVALLQSGATNQALRAQLPLVAEMSDEALTDLRSEENLATLKGYIGNTWFHEQSANADHNLTTMSTHSRAFTIDAWSTKNHDINGYNEDKDLSFSEAQSSPATSVGDYDDSKATFEDHESWMVSRSGGSAPDIPWGVVESKLLENNMMRRADVLLGDLSALGLNAEEQAFISEVTSMQRAALMDYVKFHKDDSGSMPNPFGDSYEICTRNTAWPSSEGDITDDVISSLRDKSRGIVEHSAELRQTLENHKYESKQTREEIVDRLMQNTIRSNAMSVQRMIESALAMEHPLLQNVRATPSADDPHKFTISAKYDASDNPQQPDLREISWDFDLNTKFDMNIQEVLAANYPALMGYEPEFVGDFPEKIQFNSKKMEDPSAQQKHVESKGVSPSQSDDVQHSTTTSSLENSSMSAMSSTLATDTFQHHIPQHEFVSAMSHGPRTDAAARVDAMIPGWIDESNKFSSAELEGIIGEL